MAFGVGTGQSWMQSSSIGDTSGKGASRSYGQQQPTVYQQPAGDDQWMKYYKDLLKTSKPKSRYTAGASEAPVLTDEQIKQQVNASNASTAASVENQQRQATGSAAMRGFGSNSPLAQALSGMYANQGLATKTANERETRLDAAKMNAEQTQRANMLNAQLRAQQDAQNSQAEQQYNSFLLDALNSASRYSSYT